MTTHTPPRRRLPSLPHPVRSPDGDGLTPHQHIVLQRLRRAALQHHAGDRATPLVTRQELAGAIGAPDRVARQTIAELRALGHPVLTSAAVAGAWLSDDPREILAFTERELLSRLRSLAATSRAMRRAAAAAAARRDEGARSPVQAGLWGAEGVERGGQTGPEGSTLARITGDSHQSRPLMRTDGGTE